MKNIAKLSLVAAIAVSGFTSANAQSLEDAIKNVEVSGSVVYRYNDYNNDATGVTNQSSTNNNYKVAMGLASKVNDDVKFNSRFIIGGTDSGFATLDTQNNTATPGDQNVDVTLSNAYFGYTGIKNTTVNVGKQGLTTPWTVAVDINGNEQTGTGALALSTVGPVTFAAAFFNQTNLNISTDAKIGDTKVLGLLDGSDAVATAGAIAAVGPVTLDAWYLDMDNTFDTYTIGAKSDIDLSGVKLGVDARFASLSFDDDSNDNTIAKIALTGNVGIVNAKVLYAMTDKDGGLTALDNDAVTTVNGWNTTVNGKADADYWQTTLGVNVLSNLNLSANYNNLKYVLSNSDMTEEELYAQLVYKMSKNLTSYIRYGTYTKDNDTTNVSKNDDTRGRIQVAYTF